MASESSSVLATDTTTPPEEGLLITPDIPATSIEDLKDAIITKTETVTSENQINSTNPTPGSLENSKIVLPQMKDESKKDIECITLSSSEDEADDEPKKVLASGGLKRTNDFTPTKNGLDSKRIALASSSNTRISIKPNHVPSKFIAVISRPDSLRRTGIDSTTNPNGVTISSSTANQHSKLSGPINSSISSNCNLFPNQSLAGASTSGSSSTHAISTIPSSSKAFHPDSSKQIELASSSKKTGEENVDDDDDDIVEIQVVKKSDQNAQRPTPQYPMKTGPMKYPAFKVKDKVWARDYLDASQPWVKGYITSILGKSNYNVSYDAEFKTRFLGSNGIAYTTHPENQIPAGTRVVAFYRHSQESGFSSSAASATSLHPDKLYSGTIAEHPKYANNYRYLIFFDCGQVSYVHQTDIFPIAKQCSRNKIHEEISDPFMSKFIQSYFDNYPERRMLKLEEGRRILVKKNYDPQDLTFIESKVVNVDCSLVRIRYLKTPNSPFEWLYRGSWLISDIFYEVAIHQLRAAKRSGIQRGQIGTLISGSGNSLQSQTENRTCAKSSDSTKRGGIDSYLLSFETGIRHINPRRFGFETLKTQQLHRENNDKNVICLERDDDGASSDLSDRLSDNLNDRPRGTRKDSSAESSDTLSQPQPRKTFRKSTTPQVKISDVAPKVVQRQTARKSTTPSILKIPPLPDHSSACKRIDIQPEIEIKYKPRPFVTHYCGPSCISGIIEDAKNRRGLNPFHVPIMLGWERQRASVRDPERYAFEKEIYYKAPCGRRLRNIKELFKYLRMVNSELDIDQFTFEPRFKLYADPDYRFIESAYYYEEDISKGQEPQPISGVNTVDSERLDRVEYKAERFPHENVKSLVLSRDPEFLSCCSCTDNCSDLRKCECHQVTKETLRRLNLPDEVASKYKGYEYKRLLEFVPSAIFECNERCKCNSTCLNRVVQNGIRVRLQIVRTLKKGWGVRTLDDIPKGAFICTYSAQVLDYETAERIGIKYCDEYLADLDYIDICENIKEGYEAEVVESDQEESSGSSNPEADTSDDEYSANSPSSDDEEGGMLENEEDGDMTWGGSKSSNRKLMTESGQIRRSSRSAKRKKLEKERRRKAKEEKRKRKEEREKNQPKGLRSYFGEDFAYSLDANTCGNIGRYMNHSCDPNCFVQNVFVDTHDLRFPWVSFFAGKYIAAYTELTWDYNYAIDSVPGRKMKCYCDTPKCRGRLL